VENFLFIVQFSEHSGEPAQGVTGSEGLHTAEIARLEIFAPSLTKRKEKFSFPIQHPF